jgi:hypothetical protein
MKGVKHLVQCHCILPQYRNKKNPIFHKFVVFSIIDNDDSVIPKLSQCNNCGVVHNVFDICKSEVVRGVDDSISGLTMRDLKTSLPKDVISVLESYECDIPTWENVKFIFDESLWGEGVVLAKEEIGELTQIKIMTIASENKIKIDTKTRRDLIQ